MDCKIIRRRHVYTYSHSYEFVPYSMHTILGDVVFQAALELRSKKEWIFHSNVKASVDSYLDNEPSYALRLQPGRAVRTTCTPTDGMFEYSEDGDNTVPTNTNNNITNTVSLKKNKKSKNPFENYNKENNKPRQSSASASSSRKRNKNNNNPNTIFSSR